MHRTTHRPSCPVLRLAISAAAAGRFAGPLAAAYDARRAANYTGAGSLHVGAVPRAYWAAMRGRAATAVIADSMLGASHRVSSGRDRT